MYELKLSNSFVKLVVIYDSRFVSSTITYSVKIMKKKIANYAETLHGDRNTASLD